MLSHLLVACKVGLASHIEPYSGKAYYPRELGGLTQTLLPFQAFYEPKVIYSNFEWI